MNPASLIPTSQDVPELENAFQLFLDEIKAYYPEVPINNFLSWHKSESLINNINDPSRFFRIIRDEKGDIVSYFESKPHNEQMTTQIVQWFFVHPKNRKTGILKALFEEFETWCRTNGYESIWSYTALQNKVGFSVHETLFQEKDLIGLWFGDVWWFRKKLQK